MESDLLGVVLDSSIVIEAVRQHLDVARFLRYMSASLVNAKLPCPRSASPNLHMVFIVLIRPSAAKVGVRFSMI